MRTNLIVPVLAIFIAAGLVLAGGAGVSAQEIEAPRTGDGGLLGGGSSSYLAYTLLSLAAAASIAVFALRTALRRRP